MSALDPVQPVTREEEAQLQSEGSCHRVIGAWGDQRCSQLATHVHCRNCPVYARTGRQLLDRAPAEGMVPLVGDGSPGIGADPGGTSLIVFRVGDEWLALPTRLAREVLNPLPAHRIPHRRDPRFLGIVNVRGELLPCVQLSTMLETKPASPGATGAARLIIIEREGSAWATPVDEIDGIRRVSDEALLASPVTVELATSRFTRAIVDLPRGRTGLIDEDLLWRALEGTCR